MVENEPPRRPQIYGTGRCGADRSSLGAVIVHHVPQSNPGTAILPRTPDLTGIALDGRYELHAIIGEGAFGRVYRGRDRRLARAVAVKVIKPWWAEDPAWVRKFEREAQVLASVSHPGIVQVFDVGSAPEGLYYVAELVQGESLVSRLGDGPLSYREAADIAEQLAEALGSAHDQGVVHRDVKPANVLISRTGRVKVADFGVARLGEGSTEGGGATIAGTPRYMAPEQAQGGAISPATDVYGVGVVLYEMLTGHPPFDGRSAVELALHHAHDAPPALPVDTPPPLERIVARALAKDPGERHPDATALAEELSAARVSLPADDEELGPETGSGPVATLAPPSTLAPPTTAASATRVMLRPAAAPAHGSPAAAPTPDPTLLGPPYSPRRTVNPPARRRRAVLLGLVILLGASMVAGAIALAPGQVRVPRLLGMSRGRASATTHRAGLDFATSRRYSQAGRGTVIGQTPRAHSRVNQGSTVRVVLSAGPAPVSVPAVVGQPASGAQGALEAVRLRATLVQVPAPGTPAGVVTGQSPRAGSRLLPGSSVSLRVAEAPTWRPLTGFSGTGQGRSVPFRIRGTRWQIGYSMVYQDTCALIFICSGPSLTATNLSTGATVGHFDLGEGSAQTHTFNTGPGVYQLTISPGSDAARWSIKVDDYY